MTNAKPCVSRRSRHARTTRTPRFGRHFKSSEELTERTGSRMNFPCNDLLTDRREGRQHESTTSEHSRAVCCSSARRHMDERGGAPAPTAGAPAALGPTQSTISKMAWPSRIPAEKAIEQKIVAVARLRPGRMAAHVAASLLSAVACADASPPSAQPQVPNESELQDMMSERTGAVALRDQPMTTDGVQVVFQTGHAFGMTAVALSRDGRYILSGAQDETAKLWDVASGQEVRTLTGFDLGGPRSVAFSADGTRMIVADTRGIAIIDTASGQKLRTLGSPSFNPAPLVSGDGRTGVDGGGLGATRSPRLIDLATGQVLWTLPDEGLGESAVALSRDGETLLTRLVGRTRPGPFSRKPSELSYELHVWDVSARKLRSKLPIE